MDQSRAAQDPEVTSARDAGDEKRLGLFSPGGPFEDFPGAVLVAAHNGIVLSANDVADPIARMLKGGGPEELRDAIGSALSGRAAQVNPLLVPTTSDAEGAPRAYDIVVLPWGEGTAALLLGRDITLERSLRTALVESRQRFKELVDLSADFAWETNADGQFTFVTSELPLGYDPSELLNRDVAEFINESQSGVSSPFQTREEMRSVEVWAKRSSGETACLSVSASPLFSADSKWIGARGVCWDVTAARGLEAEQADEHLHERLLSYILQIVRGELEPGPMLAAATDALMPALSATGVGIFGRTESSDIELRAQSGELPPESMVTTALQRFGEGERDIEIVVEEGRLLAHAACYRESNNGLVFLWRRDEVQHWTREDEKLLAEVSEQVGLALEQLTRESEMERLSSTDSLTGLLNRRSFEQTLSRRLGGPEKRARGGALFYIDLDNFKQVNDNHGHKQGDAVLKKVAAILKKHIRKSDIAARLGGDEFALFLDSINPAVAESRGRALLAEAEQLRALSGDEKNLLGMSVGIAVLDPTVPETLGSLLDRADRAMYEVKRAGRGNLHIAVQEKAQGAA